MVKIENVQETGIDESNLPVYRMDIEGKEYMAIPIPSIKGE